MKRTEFEQLCGELRLGKLLPGDGLDALAGEAFTAINEFRTFTAALLEGYGRVCADRKVARELLRQYGKSKAWGDAAKGTDCRGLRPRNDEIEEGGG